MDVTSLLDQIRKKQLRPTTTMVTQLDGKRYQVSKTEAILVDTNSAGFVVDTKPDNIPAQIIDRLYMGSQDCCLNQLFDYILSIGVQSPHVPAATIHKHVDCLDLPETDIKPVVDEAVSFIKRAMEVQASILVHCNAGVSRSSTVVIAYLILEKHMTYETAYDLVKNARPCIRPNDGFVKQLKELAF